VTAHDLPRTRLTAAARRALEAWVQVPVPARWRLKTPVTERVGLMKRLERLEAAYGRHGAAEAIGVKVARIRDWHRGVNPIESNLSRIDAAYEQLLATEADTPIRRRNQLKRLAESTKEQRAEVHIASELQVDGYYNGQKDKVTEDEPDPPFPPDQNPSAHRWVNFGAEDLRPYLRTYAAKGNLGAILESLAQEIITDKTFTNDFWTAPDVEFKRVSA
jgi:hypothetical protein